MRPFFFIPATKIKKVETIRASGIDAIIIDFEDAILEKERKRLMQEVVLIPKLQEIWLRVPIRNDFSDLMKDYSLLKYFLELGAKKIILPKIISKEDYCDVLDFLKAYDGIELILLIEHPRLLLELHQILQEPELEKRIYGLGLGSHDFVNFIDVAHTSDNLELPRTQVLYHCKAYQKCSIDIASMNISDQDSFKIEVESGRSMGYDSKFVVHPKQLEWLKLYSHFSADQIAWAKKIVTYLPDSYMGKDIEPFIIDGQIIEKPHVEKALTILKRIKYEE